jgi:hypothetical protein
VESHDGIQAPGGVATGARPRPAAEGSDERDAAELHLPLPDNARDKLLLAAVASDRTLSEEIEWRVEQWVALREHEAKLQAREERLAGLEAAADRVA